MRCVDVTVLQALYSMDGDPCFGVVTIRVLLTRFGFSAGVFWVGGDRHGRHFLTVWRSPYYIPMGASFSESYFVSWCPLPMGYLAALGYGGSFIIWIRTVGSRRGFAVLYRLLG